MRPKIFLHLPAYRDPELVPTIKDAIARATYPERLVFGICYQFNPDDDFENLKQFEGDQRFKIHNMLWLDAKGLPYARQCINDMITDEEYVLQLDSHHRFVQGWDETLINWHTDLENKDFRPILTGYLPSYTPFNDPAGRCMEPWQQQFACFYPHGTIFIRPSLLQGWQTRDEPVPSRFISGHFAFARSQWTKDVKHDPGIYFSGEEIDLTVRSFTHGYDLFHPPKVVVWHSTMREERNGILLWDDQSKRGEDWNKKQVDARRRIRFKLGSENADDIHIAGYEMGNIRTVHDYELYAGVCFKNRAVTQYTLDNQFPPNPKPINDSEWEKTLLTSFYHCIYFDKTNFKHDDYDFWVVAIDDANNIGIHRNDQNEHQVQQIMSRKDSIIGMEIFFTTDKKPAKWAIWGHSKSKGWAERIEGTIT